MENIKTNPERTILVPYDDYAKLSADSTRIALSLDLLYASFPDETCRMKALKAALGYKEPVSNDPKSENSEENTQGTPDPGTDPATDPEGQDPSNP